MSERSGQFDPSRTPGGGAVAGVAPPPGAPREVAMPLDPALVAQQLDRAQRNERSLPPLTFQSGQTEAARPAAAGQGAIGGGKTAPAVRGPARVETNVMPAARSSSQGGRPAVSIAAKSVPVLVDPSGQPVSSEGLAAGGPVTDPAPAASAATASQAELAPPPAIRPDRPAGKLADIARAQLESRPRLAQPAASNSDSPARGVPRGTSDPGKQITGGFGDAVGAQYFPLDGTELRKLVLSMMDRLAADLQNDLRFSIAAVYPRVAVQLELKVEGFVEDIGFAIARILPPHTKTPIEIARERADEGVFVVSVTRAEMLPDGTSLTPPNAIREELGLQVPQKRRIEVPGGYAVVDVVQSLAGDGR